MRTRARIIDDWQYGGIGIFLELPSHEAGRHILGRNQRTGQVQANFPTHDMAADPDFGPLVLLTDEEARAVLTALIRHFDGGEDTRSLRRDYDAERARVDKLIDLATRPPIVIDSQVARNR